RENKQPQSQCERGCSFSSVNNRELAMEFSPTWTDYSLLVVFASLFLLSGWLTYLVLCHEKKWLETPPIGSERGDAASNRLNLTEREITTDERYSFLEVLLIILFIALFFTSIILFLIIQ